MQPKERGWIIKYFIVNGRDTGLAKPGDYNFIGIKCVCRVDSGYRLA